MGKFFFILFRGGPPDDWMRAAQVLDLASPKLSRFDAARACRFGCGLTSKPLPKQEARAAAYALDQAGFPTVLVPSSSLVGTPVPFVISSADAYPDGFHIQMDREGTMRTVPWSSVRIVRVEYVQPRARMRNPIDCEERRRPPAWDQSSSRALSPFAVGLSLFAGAAAACTLGPLGGIATALEVFSLAESKDAPCVHSFTDFLVPINEYGPPKPVDPEVWLELFTLNPLMRLLVRQTAFNYHYLAERLTQDSQTNFALLLRDILHFAPNAKRVGRLDLALAGQLMNGREKVVEQHILDLMASALLTREAVIEKKPPESRGPVSQLNPKAARDPRKKRSPKDGAGKSK